MTAAAGAPGAADLLRSIGLLADGPVRWGERVPAKGPGLYVVELGAAMDHAPLELTKVGKWLERLPELRLDGAHPTSKALGGRIASFWWPDSPVLYAGATDRSVGGRVAALDLNSQPVFPGTQVRAAQRQNAARQDVGFVVQVEH